MTGTVTFNGWTLVGQTRLRRGLYSRRYAHRDGWTAEEIYAGTGDTLIGLLIRDEKRKTIGTVRNLKELP